MDKEQSDAFAIERFREYVKEGTGLYQDARYHDALIYFENAINVASNRTDLEKYLPNLYVYARESAYLGDRPLKSIEYAGKLVSFYSEKNPDSESSAKSCISCLSTASMR